MRSRLLTLLCSCALLAATGVGTGGTNVAGAQEDIQPAYPGIRAAFYYPWFPDAWSQEGVEPFSRFEPTLGYYQSSDREVIEAHIQQMLHGGIEAGIASWWGPGDQTDVVVPELLEAAADTTFRWALYVEDEGYGDPSPDAIAADLRYIQDRYATQPAYLRIDGRPVIFVYNDVNDDCAMAERWRAGNVINAFIVLKLAPGWSDACYGVPDDWHQYAPGLAYISRRSDFVTISPGFWRAAGEDAPRLERNLVIWHRNIRSMVATKPPWELITSFNEWGEGTSVESSTAWGMDYLTALGNNGQEIFPQKARVSGSDRYETAARLSATVFQPGVGAVYVASGLDFPDALAGGAAAGSETAPVLLTRKDALPDPTRQELARLQPQRVVVLGGRNSISDDVIADLAAATGAEPVRVSGGDRYATAAAVSKRSFEDSTPQTVLLASGTSFADGMVAGAAGAALGAPVLLTDPSVVPEPTMTELRRLGAPTVQIVGGSAAVSQAVEDQVRAALGTKVERIAGSDRYATAVRMSEVSRPVPSPVLLATGLAFPDALAAAAFGRTHALLLTPRHCVPDNVYEELKRLRTESVGLVGGASALDDNVLGLGGCPR